MSSVIIPIPWIYWEGEHPPGRNFAMETTWYLYFKISIEFQEIYLLIIVETLTGNGSSSQNSQKLRFYIKEYKTVLNLL